MPHILRRIFIAGLLTAGLGVGGCGEEKVKQEKEVPPISLEFADHTPYIDIPIPLGFTQAADPLTFTARRPPRVCYLKYEGGSEYLSVSRFYFEALPPLGWKLQMQQGGGIVYYRYSKGTESLLLTIMPVTDKTDVIIKVQPTDTLGIHETQPARP
jgi:hypothetical protein